MALKRAATLADQLADELRTAILRGDYPPGAALPSEAQLSREHRVSRITVRGAMATLRGEGLVDVAHGRGSFVRDQRPIQRIRRDAPGLHSLPRPRDGQVPVIAYMPASPHLAALLNVPNGAELLVREARSDDPDALYLTTSYLPAALADSPPLDDPNTAIADLDDALTVLGHRITHTERVSARMPTPDERDLFDLAEGVPVLQATRVTHDTDDDTPLEIRITIYPAHGIELEYRLTP